MGRRQVVRQRPLEPRFGGSNPPAPAHYFFLLRQGNPLGLVDAHKVMPRTA